MSKEVNKVEAEGIVKNFLSGGIVAKTKVIVLTIKDLVLIFVPFAIATYLLHTQADKLVLALGVAIGIVGFVNTIKLAYSYENAPKKRR